MKRSRSVILCPTESAICRFCGSQEKDGICQNHGCADNARWAAAGREARKSLPEVGRKPTTPYQKALRAAIIARIDELRKDGTVGMSMANLKQCVRAPEGLEGTPQGGNLAWQYSQKFTEAVANLPAQYNDFIL